jgi:anti-sigma factor RsiW
MTCQRVSHENLIERYLQGTLEPALRDEFEDHYFACDHCHAQLQTVQAIQPVLATLPPVAPQRPTRNYLPWLALAAAAAALLIAFLPPPQSPVAPTPTPSATLLLTEIQPAPYAPTLFRGGAPQPTPAFAAAMSLYEQRQWSAAAAALTPLAPDPVALHFAGISHLLAGKPEPALAALQRVIHLGPATPYEEEARFYRAQALLLARRPTEARAELETIIQGKGDYEAAARSLLKRL